MGQVKDPKEISVRKSERKKLPDRLKHRRKDNIKTELNHLTPNGHYMVRTAQLTSRCCILYIYSTNTRNAYFKHAA